MRTEAKGLPVGVGAWYEGQPFDMARAVAKFQCAIEGVTFREPTPCPDLTDVSPQ